MGKRVLFFALLIANGAANAEWTAIATGTDKSAVYADYSTIRRDGYLSKMWTLDDYKTKQTSLGVSYLSTKRQDEFDCKGEMTRTRAYVAFAGKMGNGKVMFSEPPSEQWQPVTPGSIGERKWEIACGKP